MSAVGNTRAAMTALLLGATLQASAQTATTPPTPVVVFAAGSLRDTLSTIARDFQAAQGQPLTLRFAASGLLRDSIERGEPAQVFASADTDHPQRLARAGGWQAPVVFVRNSLCALVQPGLAVTPDTLLDHLLDPQLRLGTSTPKADPSGDYAWALFQRAEALRPGAFTALSAKALQLTGGPGSPPPPAGRGTYEWLMAERQADVFLTYCTNAVGARRAQPQLQVVQVPETLQVGAAYGLTVRQDAPAAAQAFARHLLGPEAQAVFRAAGFAAP